MPSILDHLINRMLEVVMPKVVAIVNQSSNIGQHCFIIGTTWDPSDGTASVVRADTVFAEPPDTPVIIPRVKLAVPHTGEQYGPLPDDRVIVFRTQSGWIAYPNHDPFDSIRAPEGEKWTFHRNPMTGAVDLKIKMTNDGSVPGSGGGGMSETGATYYERATAGGHTDTFDDAPATKGITRQSSAGHKLTMDDIAGGLKLLLESSSGHKMTLDDILHAATIVSAGGLQHIMDDVTEEIAHVAPFVAMGARYADMSSVNNLVNHSHLDAFNNTLADGRLQDFITFANLLSTAGTVTPPQLITILAPLIAGWIHLPTLPDCSAVGRVVS